MTPYARALWDYAQNDGEIPPLTLETSFGDTDNMPVAAFFRHMGELSELEQHALKWASGHVLDMGAGAGCISLILQDSIGTDNNTVTAVTATDIDADLCALMRHRGVKNTLCADMYDMNTGTKFDTILSMMNGVGIAGTLDNLPAFLNTLKSHLSPHGHIIMDSTDISYLYEDDDVEQPDGYYGEVQYKYTYKDTTDNKTQGDWFPWLYVDSETLINTAENCGLETQIIYQDDRGEDFGHYLVSMHIKNN